MNAYDAVMLLLHAVGLVVLLGIYRDIRYSTGKEREFYIKRKANRNQEEAVKSAVENGDAVKFPGRERPWNRKPTS